MADTTINDQEVVNDGGSYNLVQPRWSSNALYYLKSHWKILMLGQGLSLLLSSAGAAQATLHLDCGLSAPTFTMSVIYFFLSFHLILLFWRQRKGKLENTGDAVIIAEPGGAVKSDLSEPLESENILAEPGGSVKSDPSEPLESENKYSLFGLTLHRPVWQYFIIAFLDVEANTITMLSFRYTTLTSVTLFDALAIPSAMLVSKCFVGRQYTWVHLLGVVTCMFGVVLNVMQDYESDHSSSSAADDLDSQEYPHKLRGDILAITGGLLYGLNDVLTEVTVRQNGDTIEYLGVMGFLAFLITMAQALILERQEILEFFGRDPDASSTCSLAMGWWLLFVFVGVSIFSYCGASRFLLLSEAAFFNLSLLTGDLWSVVFSVVAERIVPHPLFFLALLFVLSGVVIYEMAPSPVLEDEEKILLDNDDTEERVSTAVDENHFELQENQIT
jgi:solute carrier family 35 protein F1/2